VGLTIHISNANLGKGLTSPEKPLPMATYNRNSNSCATFVLLHIIVVIKSREMRCAGQKAHMGRRDNFYKTLVGKPAVKRLLGRPRNRY
jgi:hypothetical protein